MNVPDVNGQLDINIQHRYIKQKDKKISYHVNGEPGYYPEMRAVKNVVFIF